MEVARFREQIPACQGMVYMNAGASGPSPVSVVDAIKERLDYEMGQGPTSPDVSQSRMEIRTEAREAVAELLNAAPEEICLTKNTTEGLNIVLNGLPWRHGDELITFSLEHSSVLVPSYFQQRRHGVVVKVLPLAANEQREVIQSKIGAALSQHTRLVFLSHIQYSCGLRMPVKEIREMLKDRGIMLLLDGAQTAGHITLDVKDMDCDFYSLPGQKWLLGPEGVGALYIRKDLIAEVEPMQVAGRALLSPDEFHQFQPNISSIDNFLLTSASTPLQAGMLEAIRFIQKVGVAEIEARNLDLAARLKQALQETPGVTVLSPLERQSSSGLVSFSINGIDPKDAVSYLWDQHRIVARSVRSPSAVRVSLHFFNTEQEVDKLVEAISVALPAQAKRTFS